MSNARHIGHEWSRFPCLLMALLQNCSTVVLCCSGQLVPKFLELFFPLSNTCHHWRAVSSYSVPSTFKSNDYSIIRLLLANEVTRVICTTDVMKLLVCNFEFEMILLLIDSLKSTTYHSSKEHNLIGENLSSNFDMNRSICFLQNCGVSLRVTR